MTLTKDQWKEIEKALSIPYGEAELMIDGYRIGLHVVVNKMRLAIIWYVDGEFKMAWLFEDCEIRRKFGRPVTKRRWRKGAFKKFTKKELKSVGVDPDQTYTYYHWEWSSFAALRRHLVKQCQEISF